MKRIHVITALLGLLSGIGTAYIAQFFHLYKLQEILESVGGLLQLTILLPLFFILPPEQPDSNIALWLGGAGLGLVLSLAIFAVIYKIYFESKNDFIEKTNPRSYVYTGAIVGAMFIGLAILSTMGLGLLLYPVMFILSPIVGAIIGGLLGYGYYNWVHK